MLLSTCLLACLGVCLGSGYGYHKPTQVRCFMCEYRPPKTYNVKVPREETYDVKVPKTTYECKEEKVVAGNKYVEDKKDDSYGYGDHGNSYGTQGNNHGAHGNGYGDHGNSYATHGNNHGAHGNGYGDHGNSYATHGNTYGDHVTGYGDHGKGYGDHGNSYGIHGNNHGGHGQGVVDIGHGYGYTSQSYGHQGYGHGHGHRYGNRHSYGHYEPQYKTVKRCYPKVGYETETRSRTVYDTETKTGRAGGFDPCMGPITAESARVDGVDDWACHSSCYTRVDQEGNVSRGCYKDEFGLDPKSTKQQTVTGMTYTFCQGNHCNGDKIPGYQAPY